MRTAMAAKRIRKVTLEELEIQTAQDLERRRKKRRDWPEGKRTRIARDVRARKRLPPPVPEGLTIDEIRALDPDDPRFRHKRGRKRKVRDINDEDLDWKEAIREHKQRKTNARRARARKWEAEVIVAAKESNESVGGTAREVGVFDEDQLVANGVVSLDDWDEEELVRGYRRARNGRFGPAPKYIPREVQQEAFRRLVKIGEKKLKESYLNVVQQLIALAYNAESEKVRLEAQKEIMNRLVGKVPDHLRVAPEAPWEGFLADALVPVSEVPALEVGASWDNTPDVVDAPSLAQEAALEDSDDGKAPTSGSSSSSGGRRRSSGGSKKATPKRKGKKDA